VLAMDLLFSFATLVGIFTLIGVIKTSCHMCW